MASKSLRLAICVFLLISSVQVLTKASSFLFLLPLPTMSHHLFLRPFWEQLLARGHQITLVTGLPQFKMDRVSIIEMDTSTACLAEINKRIYTEFQNKPLLLFMELEKKYGWRTCETLCQNYDVKNLINNGTKYDVVFVSATVEDCSFLVANLLSKKIIYINNMRQIFPIYAYNLGISLPYSFSPNVASHLTSKMSFTERLSNAVAAIYYTFIFRDYKKEEEIVKTYFPQAPDLETTFEGVSLVFTNSDNVLSEAVPSTNNVIKIGGMHCKDPKPLPDDFEKVLGGKSGFVLFSLGTVAEINSVGQSTLQAFIDAFGMLNETVVWKTKHTYQNLPANIKTFSWIPQKDILGHANIRLFMTQGGIYSLQEAVYNAVPILTVPLIVDQYSNARRIEELGIGKQLDMFNNLTKYDIFHAITSIIDDSSFKKKATYYSAIFKDIDDLPVNRAVFWTEWLTRHSDVKKITRASVENMNILKYLLIDVLIFVVSSLFTFYVLVALIIKKIVKKFIF